LLGIENTLNEPGNFLVVREFLVGKAQQFRHSLNPRFPSTAPDEQGNLIVEREFAVYEATNALVLQVGFG